MKRYFLVRDEDMPTIKDRFPGMNFIDLATHGPAGHLWNCVSLADDTITPKPNWISFPKITDPKSTLAEWDMPHEVLADIGLTGEETCMEAVYKFEIIHSAMG